MRLLIYISATIFVSLILWTVAVLDTIEGTVKPHSDSATKAGAVFHFVVLMPSMERDLFYIRAYNGLKEVADKERTALQVFEYPFGEGEEAITRRLGLIKDVSPDGIILSLPGGNSFDGAIKDAVRSGIPVVTLENDLPSSGREAHIGTNAFELGKLAGRAVARRFPERGRVGVLLSLDGGRHLGRDATFIQGMRQILREFPGLQLELLRSASEDKLGGEEFIREILTEHPDIDVAVFTDARNAEGAAQALIEFGKVGTPAIVGFDDTPEMRKLMEMGVIYAIIARNAETAGSEALRALLALARGERTNAYIDPGAEILDADSTLQGRRQQ